MSRLLVVDEHPIVGIALKALLTDEADFVVQASTELGAAERAIADGTADIIVSEIAFAGASRGLDLLRAHSSRPPIVLFTGLNHPGVFQAALDARAEGVVSKAAPLTEVVDAIRIVAAPVAQLLDLTCSEQRGAPPPSPSAEGARPHRGSRHRCHEPGDRRAAIDPSAHCRGGAAPLVRSLLRDESDSPHRDRARGRMATRAGRMKSLDAASRSVRCR